MRPEISSLITPLIYEGLMNDVSVLEFEDVKGITKSLFFLEHNNYEQGVSIVVLIFVSNRISSFF